MTCFRVFVIGSPLPLDVDLPFEGIPALSEAATRCRFIEGHMAEPDQNGVCAAVLIPTNRIQLIFELT